MNKKEFNEKLAVSVFDFVVNILHDDSAQYVDQTQIIKHLCRLFKANEWETQFILSRIVEVLVTARPAVWHIMARNVSGQNSKDRRNWRVWEKVPDDEKEKWK